MNNNAIATIYSRWSVASSFNSWGMWRFENSNEEGGHVAAVIKNVDSVANCIRELGYEVDCGFCNGAGTYIIMCIYRDTSEGSGIPEMFYYGTKFSCSVGEHLNHHRTLAGHRTIYEAAKNFVPEVFSADNINLLEDISSILTEKKIKTLIHNGSTSTIPASRERAPWFCPEKYINGVSTIGNTLPNDIVNALENFTSDCHYFVKEPAYEFYIPEFMLDCIDMACPVAELSLAKDVAEYPSQESGAEYTTAIAVAAPVTTISTRRNVDRINSSSNSDDSEDDD